MGVLAFGDTSTWATRADGAKPAPSEALPVNVAVPDRKVGTVVSLKAVKAPSVDRSAARVAPRNNPNFAPREAWPGAPSCHVPSLHPFLLSSARPPFNASPRSRFQTMSMSDSFLVAHGFVVLVYKVVRRNVKIKRLASDADG